MVNEQDTPPPAWGLSLLWTHHCRATMWLGRPWAGLRGEQHEGPVNGGDVGDNGLGFHQQQRLGLTRRRAVSLRPPFLPWLGSGQCPVTPESPLRLGVCPGPLPPAHFRLTSSHPARKQRPAQPSTSHQTFTLGLPSHCAAARLTSPRACGYFLRPTPKWPKGTPVLFSLCPGVPPVPSLPHNCSALPTNMRFLVRIHPHSGSLRRDSRHIE